MRGEDRQILIYRSLSIYARFAIKNRSDFAPRYNVAPTQEIPVIDEPHHVELMRWRLIPFWARDAKIGYSMINARAEGIADKLSYHKPFRLQRCIIPADGFFEWKQTKNGSKRKWAKSPITSD